MKYGFVKVAAAVPAVKVADVDYNVQQIESIIAQAEGRGVEVIVFRSFVSQVTRVRTSSKSSSCSIVPRVPSSRCSTSPANSISSPL